MIFKKHHPSCHAENGLGGWQKRQPRSQLGNYYKEDRVMAWMHGMNADTNTYL